jgi:hydroxyacylglutathione hydrolase
LEIIMPSPLLIKTLVSPPLETNCYVVADADSRVAIAIDPASVADEIVALCRANNWRLEAIVCTHGHIDHTQSVPQLANETGAPVLIHAADAPMLESEILSGAAMIGMDFEPCKPGRLLQDQDEIAVGAHAFRVLHTPGHTPGCICLLDSERCFTGDLLFKGAVGRWDFPGGDQASLQASLRRIAELCGDDMKLYPGHGDATTMGRERKTNPFLVEWL